MQLPADLVNQAFMFGLIIGSIVIAWFIGAALGGWQFGDFLRRIEIITTQGQMSQFAERLQHRLAELGFTPTGNPEEFLQGGAHFEDVGAFTHAKTPKLLTVAMDTANPAQIKIQLALRYQNTIVADTGEGAYRDALLDYISGKTDTMTVIPNRSFLAVCALVGGGLAWVTIFGSKAVGFGGYFRPVLALGLTYFSLGLFAIVSIVRKAGQATGLPWAIIGVVANAAAIIAVIALKVLSRI
ncbi:MAG: hypothetical protein QM813_19335 [Verrucomicrobiota bacterium]